MHSSSNNYNYLSACNQILRSFSSDPLAALEDLSLHEINQSCVIMTKLGRQTIG